MAADTMPEYYVVAPLQKSLAILKLALTRPDGTRIGSETVTRARHIPGGPIIFQFSAEDGGLIYIEVWPGETEESVRQAYEAFCQ